MLSDFLDLANIFFKQINLHKDFLVKVGTGETKSLNTIKCLNENENKSI